jgi:hypothetical protein
MPIFSACRKIYATYWKYFEILVVLAVGIFKKISSIL